MNIIQFNCFYDNIFSFEGKIYKEVYFFNMNFSQYIKLIDTQFNTDSLIKSTSNHSNTFFITYFMLVFWLLISLLISYVEIRAALTILDYLSSISFTTAI